MQWRLFQRMMRRLAILATLLMVCAPLLSRWVQAYGPLPASCDAMAMDHAGMGPEPMLHEAMAGHVHAGGDPAMSMPMHTAVHAEPASAHDAMPVAGGHDMHGEACDYCVLGARLLLAFAIAWLLLPPLHLPMPAVRCLLPVFLPAVRRAHAPRGPPLAA